MNVFGKKKLHAALGLTGYKSSTYTTARNKQGVTGKVEYGRNKWGERFVAVKKGKKVSMRSW